MKIIVLAAGLSKRLHPLTKNKNKCLIEIGGLTFLERTINACLKNNLDHFIFVIGHGGKLLEKAVKERGLVGDFKYEFIRNHFYKTKNNYYSLYLGIKGLYEDIIIINSDVIFDGRILGMLKNQKDTTLVVDDKRKLDKEDMKVLIENERIASINKNLPLGKSYGEYIGIAKIAKNDLRSLRKALEKIEKINPDYYYEDAFQIMISEGIFFNKLSTNGLPWAEVDTFRCLRLARKLVKDYKLD